MESLVTLACAPAAHPIYCETHKNSSLLFQFILSEFIEAFDEIQTLNSLVRQVSPRRENVQQLLQKLLGSFKGGIRYFPWNFADGLLHKLQTYCILLHENNEHYEKELIAIQHYLEKVRAACSSALDILNRNMQEVPDLSTAIEKASLSMQRLSKLMARLMQQFREDENVLFFILRHKIHFDKLYGSRFVFKLLTRMYPKGLEEMRQHLAKNYARRGFENVLDPVNLLISELEASSA